MMNASPGLDCSVQNDYLRQELLNVRFEYERLFNFYQSETEEKTRLQEELVKESKLKLKIEAELVDFENRVNLNEYEVIRIRKLRAENKKLQGRRISI